MPNPIQYSVVVPVYNSTDSLIELSDRLETVFKETLKASYEVIFVDDASPNPETWPTLQKLQQLPRNISIVQLTRNFGKPGAVLCGFSQVQGKFVVMMDDDLQHFPEDIPHLAQKKNHDIVIGHFKKKEHGWAKRVTSDMKGWLDSVLLGKPKHVSNGAFVLLKREVVDAVLKLQVAYPYISALLFFVSKDVVNVDVRHGKRTYGKTGYTLGKLVGQFLNFIINNSSLLLRGVAVVGMLFSTMSIVLGIYYFVRSFFQVVNVPGWTSMIVVMLFSTGLILFALGVIGEYLIRIINGIENRPSYIVRHKRTSNYDK